MQSPPEVSDLFCMPGKDEALSKAYFDRISRSTLPTVEGAVAVVTRSPITPFTPDSPLETASSLANTVPLPQPIPSLISSIPTPLNEGRPDFNIASLAGIDLALPSPPMPKVPPNLRLPPFNLLGIAAPHPDSVRPNSGPSICPLGVGHPSNPSNPLHSCGPAIAQPFSSLPPSIGDSSPSTSPDSQRSHKAVTQFVLTQTPPDDRGIIDWGPSGADVADETMDSNDATPTGEVPSMADFRESSKEETSRVLNFPSAGLLLTPEGAPWLLEALPIILNNIDKDGGSSGHLKILSHALPTPSPTGHAFPTVIDAIEHSTNPSSIVWINVWHAVSGRFSLEDLPRSPCTPAPPGAGDDYFSSKVFNMAVEVPDYSRQATKTQPLNQTPQPAISPASIDVSIVERYIPPGSIAEFSELFSTTGRSFLGDRLIELSPNRGTLLFIYPTRAGGETFKKEYIGPILDPLLREMGTAHDLSTNILIDIGAMVAVNKLLTYEDMCDRLNEYIRGLSGGDRSTPYGRYSRGDVNYSVIHSSKQEVKLDREVWAKDWWNKQEKAKIQRAFQDHHVERAAVAAKKALAISKATAQVATAMKETRDAAHSGNDLASQRAKTESLMRAYKKVRGEKRPEDNEQLILELLQRVATKPYRGPPPSRGVEVGVFVIRKTMKRPSMTRMMSGMTMSDDR